MKSNLPVFQFALRPDLEGKTEFLPSKAHPTDSGWDVSCAEESGVFLHPFECKKIRLGFRAIPPPGWWYELRPRSSTFAKKHLHSLYGVIDEQYENELVFACQYIPDRPGIEIPKTFLEGWLGLNIRSNVEQLYHSKPLRIEFGEKIAQIIPMRRQDMDIKHISNAQYAAFIKERSGSRGEGGFGSTG